MPNTCPAASIAPESVCSGPSVVTLTNGAAGIDACEAHGPLWLAAIPGSWPYALPDAPAGAAHRAFTTAR